MNVGAIGSGKMTVLTNRKSNPPPLLICGTYGRRAAALVLAE
jgi:hypothetical protein